MWMDQETPEPYREWALQHFRVQTYIDAAQEAQRYIQEICAEEGEALSEEFNGTYWELHASPFFGKHKTWEGAIVILAHLHLYDYEGG